MTSIALLKWRLFPAVYRLHLPYTRNYLYILSNFLADGANVRQIGTVFSSDLAYFHGL